ncbi:hypothetical protein [Mesorhizobium sp. WSM2239]|uniref:Uncharacterized protein n=2 Tax=unclassified Mesorhizobium TaxID=325217 RepID=A0AAU8D4E8_9HYPH
MTAQIDPRVLKLAERLDHLVAEEARLMQARAAHIAKAERADSDIMDACRAVGEASDAIAQAKFAGASELTARRKLERAAAQLAKVMRKHGRGPR